MVFQVAQNLTVSNAASISLAGGALARNVFWQVAGAVDIGATAHIEGVILTATSIMLRTGASINGRLLAVGPDDEYACRGGGSLPSCPGCDIAVNQCNFVPIRERRSRTRASLTREFRDLTMTSLAFPLRVVTSTLAAALMIFGSAPADAQQAVRVRSARHLTAGQSFALHWRQTTCDATAVGTAPIQSLDGHVTVLSVDRVGEPTALELVVEHSTALPRSPVPAAGALLRYERLPTAHTRSSDSDWRGASGPDEVSLTILRHLFPAESDALFGTPRAASVGDSWALGPLDHREGIPLQAARLRGRVHLAAQEDLAGVATIRLTVDAMLMRPIVLWRGAHRSELRAFEEHREVWIPTDANRPWVRFRSHIVRTTWTDAPELGPVGSMPVAQGPREITAQRCDEIGQRLDGRGGTPDAPRLEMSRRFDLRGMLAWLRPDDNARRPADRCRSDARSTRSTCGSRCCGRRRERRLGPHRCDNSSVEMGSSDQSLTVPS